MKIVLNNVQAVKLSQILARVKDRIIQKGKSSLSDHLLVDAIDDFLDQVPFADIYDEVRLEVAILEEIYNIEKNN
tara:strand:- start:7029 stop:7253 length:225 start_codon:yes stop_codon:yes gene_type:complete